MTSNQARHSYIREVAANADVPVINLQSDIDHPTQTLADLMTMREKFPDGLRGRKIAVSWAYAPSYAKPMSVPQGLISLMTRYGMNVTLAHPTEYELMKDIVQDARNNANASGGKFEIVHDMDEAFRDADVVYPKSWGMSRYSASPKRLWRSAESTPAGSATRNA